METKKIEKSLVPFKKQSGLILDKANELKIKTEAEIKVASDVLSEIDGAQKRIKAERDKIMDPAREIIKWATLTFGPLLKRYDEAEDTIKLKMKVFDEKQRAITNRKLKAMADKIAAGKISIDQASEKIEELKQPKSYSGESGSVQFREIKIPMITDMSKLPRKYLIPNSVMIRADLLAGIKIPGVELKIKRTVAKGRK